MFTQDYKDHQIYNKFIEKIKKQFDNKIPIRRGCTAAEHGGCFCTDKCKEIIGYRDKHPLER